MGEKVTEAADAATKAARSTVGTSAIRHLGIRHHGAQLGHHGRRFSSGTSSTGTSRLDGRGLNTHDLCSLHRPISLNRGMRQPRAQAASTSSDARYSDSTTIGLWSEPPFASVSMLVIVMPTEVAKSKCPRRIL